MRQMNRLFYALAIITLVGLLNPFGFENLIASGMASAAPAALQQSVGGKTGITAVAISPDGKLLAGGNEGTQIDLWNVSTGQLVRTLPGHLGAAVTQVAFSPDGTILASAGRDS